MEGSLCIIDRYFNILSKLGHLPDEDTLYIFAYLLIQDMMIEFKEYITTDDKHTLDVYISTFPYVSCIIDSCVSCNNND
jgi:hypothetical protein